LEHPGATPDAPADPPDDSARPVTAAVVAAAQPTPARKRTVPGTGAKKRRIILIAFALCLVSDLATKSWVFWGLQVPDRPVETLGEPIDIVPPYLVFRRQVNPGVAFGLGRDSGPMLLSTVMVGAIGLVMWLIRVTPSTDRAMLVGFGMIAGGAFGNLYDRLTYRVVRDFIDIRVEEWGFQWHTFNFADTWVVSGGILIALAVILAPKPPAAPAPAAHVASQS
jgi:signal peptidase II